MADKKDEQSADRQTRELRKFFKQYEGLDSNIVLAFFLNALLGSVNRGIDALVRSIDAQTKDHGKWEHIKTYAMAEGLAAIALAASTPTDNSGEVKEATAKIKAGMDELELAVDEAKPK